MPTVPAFSLLPPYSLLGLGRGGLVVFKRSCFSTNFVFFELLRNERPLDKKKGSVRLPASVYFLGTQ